MKHTKKERKMKFYTLDNVISKNQLFRLYNTITQTHGWSLNRTSKGFNDLEAVGFPGMVIEEKENFYNPYLAGYFHSLLDNINLKFKKEYDFSLPSDIYRIHLTAKNNTSETSFHRDSPDDSWTILGFITPVWKLEDGGEFKLEGEIIPYIPGRFIIFRSNLVHNGGFVKTNNLDYWRLSLNIILNIKT